MTQDEQDNPSKSPEDHVEDSPLLDQAALDALLAAQAGSESPLTDDTPLDAVGDPLMDNTPLDGVREEDSIHPVREDIQPKPNAPGEPIPEPNDVLPPPENVATQEDLDRLVASLMQEEAPTEPPPQQASDQTSAPDVASASSDDMALSQEELDRMLAASAEERSAPVLPPEAAASPDAVAAPDTASASSDDMALSQEELDRMLAASAEERSAPEAPQEDTVTPEQHPDAPLHAAAEQDGLLDQAALDALLSGAATDTAAPSGMDAPLIEADPDKTLVTSSEEDVLIVEEEAEAVPSGPMTQSQIDKIMAGTSKKGTAKSPSKDISTAAEPVSQDTIDRLIASMSGAASSPDEEKGAVVSENLAAAATAPPSPPPAIGLLTQEELDAHIARAQEEERRKRAEKQLAIEKALSETAAPVRQEDADIEEFFREGDSGGGPGDAALEPSAPRPPRAPSAIAQFVHAHIARIAVSLAAGLLVTLGSFTWLYMNQEIVPAMDARDLRKATELELAMRRAERFFSVGDYQRAAQELERPIARAAPSKERSDAQFLQIESMYRDYFEYGGHALTPTEIINRIDQAVGDAAAHPRIPEAVYWKAKLFEKDALPYAAMDAYRQLIEQYSSASNSDKVLWEAAQLALELRNPRETSEYAQRLLRQFPGSPHAPEARMLLGDAYAMAGMDDDARTLYVRVAQAHMDDATGAAAYLRLARLAMGQQKYDEAITHLESRMKGAVTAKGNDHVHLLLAQAYRMKGRRDKARETLNDLINFFPDSEVMPEAYVELSQVLDELGQRKEAVRVAQQAAGRYPVNPLALRNAGELLGLEGNAMGAASMLLAADEAGAGDPVLLLTAARHYRALNMREQARDTFALLRRKYARAPQALTAGIEEAQVLYDMGHVAQALGRMDELVLAAHSGDQRLAVMHAATALYRDMGLGEKVVEFSRQIAGITADPQLLAETSIDLLDAGAVEDARRVIDRIDLSRVKSSTAYALLMKEGKALMDMDPRRGLDRMEQAYLSYPETRRMEDEQDLIEAYLAADRPAAVRRMVMEKRARVREAPIELPHFIDAAVTWADYLFAKGDYRAAADAYALAQEAAAEAPKTVTGLRTDIAWAKYQRANALLELNDFQTSLALFSEIAITNTPWAKEAAVKADFARLEQRLRGETPLAREG